MIELSDLKDALQIPSGTTDHDAYLTELEEAAVAHVQRVTGWYIGPEDATAELVVPGTGKAVLWLPEKVSAVASIFSRSHEGGTETEILTADDDGWVLRKPSGETHGLKLVRKGGHLWSELDEYRVTATIGYTAGSEPAEDRADVTSLVVHWFENRLPVVTGTITARVPDHLHARMLSRRKGRV